MCPTCSRVITMTENHSNTHRNVLQTRLWVMLCWEFCGLKRRVNPLKHCRKDPDLWTHWIHLQKSEMVSHCSFCIANIKDCNKTDQSRVLYQCRQILVSILAHYTVLSPGLPHGCLSFVMPVSSKIRREKVVRSLFVLVPVIIKQCARTTVTFS